MDVLDFLAHSEWPLIGGAALWLIRGPLVRMLDRVNPTKVDAWGLKAEFERRIAKVEALTPKAGEQGETAVSAEDKSGSKPTWAPATPAERINYLDLAPPEVVIMESWRQLESSMRKVSDARRPRGAQRLGPLLRIDMAARELGLTDDEIAALKELRILRNDVAHSTEASVTVAEAARFRAAAERLAERLTKTAKPTARFSGESEDSGDGNGSS